MFNRSQEKVRVSLSLNGSNGFILTRRFVIEDSSQIGECRRQLTRLAQDLLFSETEVGQIAIVLNELAKNILQHAGKGEILIREICRSSEAGKYGIEMMALDRGPGMNNPSACLIDGFSTGSTPGTGLGAVQRLAQDFDLYSKPGKGTVIAVSFHTDQTAGHPAKLQSSVICIPIAGEIDCGDSWSQISPITGDAVMVADGLGHGSLASTASREAIHLFRDQKWRNFDDLFRSAHARMRSTRGAAVSVARFDELDQSVHFAGVGNVRAFHHRQGKTKTLLGYAGTVGLKMTTVREVSEPWAEGDVLVIHSDGLTTRCDLIDYPGLQKRSPAVIAAVLYRDFSRGNDDSCVWVGCFRERKV
jgi:anti-sigma regulatory factor (Ser/Thr protein kinase)